MKRGLKREYMELKDGRRLCYIVDRPTSEVTSGGGSDLPFVFYFPGMFGKGSDFVCESPSLGAVGVYLDRPGYGDSDVVADASTWSYTKFAEDMEQLADHLEVETFYVLGHSSGGPCALACGAHLSDRVIGIAVLSGDPEYAAPNAPKEQHYEAMVYTCLLPSLLCCLSVGGWCGFYGKRIKGSKADYQVERKPYDFQVESITQPTLFLTGKLDTLIPPHLTEFSHERLHGSELLSIDSANHMALTNSTNLKTILAKLLAMEPK
jgi:pimeloyl-ACP methyl ester carboxylesterase